MIPNGTFFVPVHLRRESSTIEMDMEGIIVNSGTFAREHLRGCWYINYLARYIRTLRKVAYATVEVGRLEKEFAFRVTMPDKLLHDCVILYVNEAVLSVVTTCCKPGREMKHGNTTTDSLLKR